MFDKEATATSEIGTHRDESGREIGLETSRAGSTTLLGISSVSNVS